MVDADLLSRKRDKSGVLGANRRYAARAVFCTVSTAEGCTLASAIAYMRPTSQVEPKVFDILLASTRVPDVYDVEIDSEGECDLSDRPNSCEIDVRSILRGGFTTIYDKFSKYSVEGSTTSAAVFEQALLGFIRLRSNGIYCQVWTGYTIRSSCLKHLHRR